MLQQRLAPHAASLRYPHILLFLITAFNIQTLIVYHVRSALSSGKQKIAHSVLHKNRRIRCNTNTAAAILFGYIMSNQQQRLRSHSQIALKSQQNVKKLHIMLNLLFYFPMLTGVLRDNIIIAYYTQEFNAEIIPSQYITGRLNGTIMLYLKAESLTAAIVSHPSATKTISYTCGYIRYLWVLQVFSHRNDKTDQYRLFQATCHTPRRTPNHTPRKAPLTPRHRTDRSLQLYTHLPFQTRS